MLEYGLVPVPESPKGRDRRWFIKTTAFDSSYRYLHLQEKRWYGWAKVRDEMISSYTTSREGFEYATREAAKSVVEKEEVLVFLPLGEVK
jgi:hypothetical protein